jgi:hypothetical protein
MPTSKEDYSIRDAADCLEEVTRNAEDEGITKSTSMPRSKDVLLSLRWGREWIADVEVRKSVCPCHSMIGLTPYQQYQIVASDS